VLHKDAWKNSFHFGGWQAVAQLGGILSNQIDKYILGALLAPAAVGIYNVAYTVEQRAYNLVFTVSEVLFPAFSSLNNEALELKADALMKASWILTVLSVCVITPLIPLAHGLLALWINHEVANQGSVILQTLAVAGTLGCATNASYFFLLGSGQTRIITLLAVITGLVTIIVSASVLPRFGLVAAGSSGVAAMLVQIVFVNIMIRKLFGHVLPWTVVITSLYVPIVVGLSISFTISLVGHPAITTWLQLILSYCALAAGTLAVIVAICRILPHGRERTVYMSTLFKSMWPLQSMKENG